MTADGNYFYFVSERPGGQGQADIYYIKKNGKSWTEPTSVGSTINTNSDEKCVFVHPSGNLLFFSSNGYKESLGSYDLYYCYKEDNGNWSKPINMGYPINTVNSIKENTRNSKNPKKIAVWNDRSQAGTSIEKGKIYLTIKSKLNIILEII